MTRPLHQRLLIRAARAARPAQRLWWRLRRPTVMGAVALVVNEAGDWLLVRHTYMRGWHFPGGGVKTRESVRDALLRELREEVGVTTRAEPHLVGVYTNLADPRSSHVALYRIDAFEMTPRPNIEIAEWRFVKPGAFPPGTGRGPLNRWAEIEGRRTNDGTW